MARPVTDGSGLDVDRDTRLSISRALRRFVGGEITNSELDDVFDKATPNRDPAIDAVAERVWFTYSDVGTYTATGRHELSPETRDLLLRCAMFLSTALPYEWPIRRFISGWALLRWVPFIRRKLLREQEGFRAAGDWSVWPFIRESDFKTAAAEGPR